MTAAVRWGRGTPYRASVYAGLFGLTALIGYFGPLGFALLAALGGLLIAPVALRLRRPAPEWLALAALAIWAAATLLWSPITPTLSAEGYGELERNTAAKLGLQLAVYGLLVAGATRLSVAAAQRALWVLSAGLLLWAVLLLGDGFSGGRVWSALTDVVGVETTLQFREKKAAEGAYVLAVLAWPAAGFLWSKGWRAPALAIIAGTAVGAAGLSAFSVVAALLAGGVALLLVGQGRSTGALTLGLLFAVALVVAPLIALEGARSGLFEAARDRLTASWAARTDIWAFAAERIAEQPLRGWGLDASRTFGLSIPLHPHDAPLQLWLELGLVGVVIAMAFWFLLARRLAAMADVSPSAAATAAASAAAYFTVGALSFGVWQEWWLAAGAVAWAACAAHAIVRASEEAELEQTGLPRV